MPPAPTCDCGDCRKCRHRGDWYRNQPVEKRRELGKRARQADPEGVRERDRIRYHERKVSDDAYALKRSARSALNNAVRDGRVKRLPCEVCGDADVQGHHDDYARPLSVRWLCREHHGLEHRIQVEAPVAA